MLKRISAALAAAYGVDARLEETLSAAGKGGKGGEDGSETAEDEETESPAEAAARPHLSFVHCEEMCRYGGAEVHAVAALAGGVVAQEAVKLITVGFGGPGRRGRGGGGRRGGRGGDLIAPNPHRMTSSHPSNHATPYTTPPHPIQRNPT